jgi:ribonuclease R/exosome complex exonuclease DIS3/RRP44
MTSWKEGTKNPNGEIVKVLGYSGDNDVEIHSILHEYDLPYNFEQNILEESENISDVITEDEISKRRDMREKITFTIDPADAKDFDDALSVEWVNGQLEVGIHIADVSHYLKPETDLDKEAYHRGTSVYLVDRVVPMLPERLSNGLCSLRPNEDKLCFSAIFTLDQNGTVIDEWFGKTIINSNVRYTYEEAQTSIEDRGTKLAKRFNEYKESTNVVGLKLNEKDSCDAAIRVLDSYAKKLRKQRLGNGAISFDKHEVKFKLNEENKPVDILFKVSKDSNKLIEEFMLLANRRVAQLLNKNEYPVVNRVHESPLPERLMSLKEFIKQFEYTIKTNTPQEITKSLNQLLLDVNGKIEENMISNLVVRTMQKAHYSTKNLGHYGLGFDDYAHFTSPIRRYPDVMTHRLLTKFLANYPVPSVDPLETKCLYLSERERKAQKAERDSIKYMQALYMSERIGQIYAGMVTSITDYGVFVEISETKSDGLVKLSDILGNFTADMKNYCIKSMTTGEVIKLGDVVNVIVNSVDVEKKTINLNLVKL